MAKQDSGSDQNETRPQEMPVDREAFAELVELARQRSEGSKVYLYGTLLGIAIGGLAFIGGFVLALLGLSGAIEWVVEAGSLSSRLSNASPGIVFAVAGMIVVWRYKPRVSDHLEIGPESLKHDSGFNIIYRPEYDSVMFEIPPSLKDIRYRYTHKRSE